MPSTRALAALCMGALASCNLVVSLDDLQDGAGGAPSTGSSPSSPASVSASISQSVASASTASTAGAGGAPLDYDQCVDALGPVVRLRLDAAGAASEPNAGSWGGDALYEGTRASEAPLATASVASASFSPDGALALETADGFFGGTQAFTIELWFQTPADYGEEVVSLQVDTEGFYLRIQERMDVMGLDSIQFRFYGTGVDRSITENLDLSGGGAHHLVAVYKEATLSGGVGDDLTVFVDGVPSANQASGSDGLMPALDGLLSVGNEYAGPIDEVAIYPVALEPDAIAALHLLGSGQNGTCPLP